uniref:hypothetical protein n=1 Tax=uncultured Draconibacterium sp. TaxID=1573823 RepID=UPI003217F6D9
MKRVSVNIKKEIAFMDMVDTAFINNQGNAVSIYRDNEMIGEILFVELFEAVSLKDLFSQRIFSRN